MPQAELCTAVWQAQKILVVGNCGSGKSWLAARVAAHTGLPLTHLDMAYWRPDWQPTPSAEWEEAQRDMTAAPRWILDGNYAATMEIRFAAADAVIFIDRPRPACLVGLVRRNGKKREDFPAFLSEKLDAGFLDLVKWMWSFPKRSRPVILALQKKYPGMLFLRLKSRRQLRWFLRAAPTARTPQKENA